MTEFLPAGGSPPTCRGTRGVGGSSLWEEGGRGWVPLWTQEGGPPPTVPQPPGTCRYDGTPREAVLRCVTGGVKFPTFVTGGVELCHWRCKIPHFRRDKSVHLIILMQACGGWGVEGDPPFGKRGGGGGYPSGPKGGNHPPPYHRPRETTATTELHGKQCPRACSSGGGSPLPGSVSGG